MKLFKHMTKFIFLFLIIFSSASFGEEIEVDDLMPEISGSYAVTIDVETGEIIYAKDIDVRTYPASTTKIMTALIFAENMDKNDVLTYTEDALLQPSYSLNKDYGPFNVGYEMTGDTVMKSLLLYSANDVAVIVKDALASKDIDLMRKINNRFKALGLKNSNFVTPNGLHDENHYTSAYDLALMTKESFSNPWIQEVLSLDETSITIETGVLKVENSNVKLNNRGQIFSKTGYTKFAGRCLVAVYERDGRKLVGVVLDSVFDPDDTVVFKDMDIIMDWSFEQNRISFMDDFKESYSISVDYYPLKYLGEKVTQEIPLVFEGDYLYYPNEVNRAELTYETVMYDMDAESLNKETPVGELVIKSRNMVQKINLYPTLDLNDLYAQHSELYRLIFYAVVVLTVILLLSIALLVRRLRKGKRKRFY
ncbi:D-alanyl-D-alanine carboxypeptidase [Acidaminobacter sp. JC074]|uniref:D-alanyl-D-alanine carboxypeptidase family protein n=1 Tax=Acidaminobacter sp. JC074 TaxID=2530199 RepID=UPI001F0DA1C1|nr:D-alanyl-D-alanine carboxypeptidase [Acidaminobacter sp. JC074]MCH4889966.1 D-alanyl-D-alanine carboxypeptidase [Acidaminobacter sp. JC074]